MSRMYVYQIGLQISIRAKVQVYRLNLAANWSGADFAALLLCTFPRLSLLSMAQQYIVFLPASQGVAPSFLQLEIFLSQTCFSIFLFIGKRYEASM